MAEQARLFCDVGLARRIEAAETELIAVCARAARARTGDGFVDRIGGGVESFTGADSPFTKVAGVGVRFRGRESCGLGCVDNNEALSSAVSPAAPRFA